MMGPLGARLFVGLQHLLPQHTLSRFVYRMTRSRRPAFKNLLIDNFVRGFQPVMEEASQPDPLAYASFNEFFTRTLRPDVRSIDANPLAVTSPVDGTISQIGRLEGLRMIQAKNRDFTLEALLGGPSQWTERLAGGAFATLYLAPYNYHRIHMPLDGSLRAAWYVPGRLFSVNTVTAGSVAGLFARNERVICMFEHGPMPFAMVLVGALFVGSIATIWHGDVTPYGPKARTTLEPRSGAPLALKKGEEMGRFNMGSTVILVLPPDTMDWSPSLHAGDAIRLGQRIGSIRT
jgi:phosphatidylserine decarboxylase